jgi:hypothetical protein
MSQQHANIWAGIDAVATAYGLTTSGLAVKAGLDNTALNPSKRVFWTAESGFKLRWPSTDSIAKIMEAVDIDFITFAYFCEYPEHAAREKAEFMTKAVSNHHRLFHMVVYLLGIVREDYKPMTPNKASDWIIRRNEAIRAAQAMLAEIGE